MNSKGFGKFGCILALAAVGCGAYVAICAGPTYFGVIGFKDDIEPEVQRLLTFNAPEREIKAAIIKLANKKFQSSDNPNPVLENRIQISRDKVTIDFDVTYNLGFTKTQKSHHVEVGVLRF